MGPCIEHRTLPAVLSLRVLPDDHEVDIVGRGHLQRRVETGQEPDGSQVDVLVETLPDGQQQSLDRHVVGHPGRTDCTEQYRIALGENLQAVVRHHGSVVEVIPAAPVELLAGEGYAAVNVLDGPQNAQAFVHDLDADPVTGDEFEREVLHGRSHWDRYRETARNARGLVNARCTANLAREGCYSFLGLAASGKYSRKHSGHSP